MLDILKKTIMAGIGAGVQTRDKVEEVLNEWVEKGRMTSAEAKELADRIIEAGRAEYEKARKELGETYEELLRKGHLVTQQQFEELENRVKLLERQLVTLTAEHDATKKGPGKSAASDGGSGKGG